MCALDMRAEQDCAARKARPGFRAQQEAQRESEP
jgi:hypothetical protein